LNKTISHVHGGGCKREDPTNTIRLGRTIMATTAGQGEGKTTFVRDLLQRDSRVNERSINEAWKAAGNEGTISGTLVYKVRKDLGLTGKRQSADGSRAGEAAAVKPKSPS
jgi:hypothetical protein